MHFSNDYTLLIESDQRDLSWNSISQQTGYIVCDHDSQRVRGQKKVGTPASGPHSWERNTRKHVERCMPVV